MAENKKSFILYCDMIHTVDKLSDAKAGKLLKTILAYVNDKNPAVEDLLLQVVFEPIKHQLKRDLVRWDEFKKKQSLNGKLGGRPVKLPEPEPPEKTQINPDNPSLLSESQKSLNVTVNDTVTVNANVTTTKGGFVSAEINSENFEPYKTKILKDESFKQTVCRLSKSNPETLIELFFKDNITALETWPNETKLRKHIQSVARKKASIEPDTTTTVFKTGKPLA